MRAVLNVFDVQETDRWLSPAEVAEKIHGEPSTRSEVESVRRAMKSLAASGRLELEVWDALVDVRPARVSAGDWLHYRRGHDAWRAHLYGHRLLSVEEREQREQITRTSLDTLVNLDRQIAP